MPRNVRFAPLIDESLPRLSGSPRKVLHSATNFMQASAHSMMEQVKAPFSAFSDGGMKSAGKVTAEIGASSLLSTSNTGGLVLGTGGMVVGAMTIAGYAAGATAAAAAFSGPQAAITGGVIGLVLLAKAAYSNREAAHAELVKYGWTMIDDSRPLQALDKATIERAGEAALTLIQDGQNQIQLMDSKILSAKTGLQNFIQKIIMKLEESERILANDPNSQRRRMTLLDECGGLVGEGMAPGGAIAEYVRRVVHAGNYIQAPQIYALAIREKMLPGSIDNHVFPDCFAGTTVGDWTRESFTKLEAFCDYVEQVARTGAGAAAR